MTGGESNGRLGEALKKMSDEPVNEGIRGEEEYWKPPPAMYTIYQADKGNQDTSG